MDNINTLSLNNLPPFKLLSEKALNKVLGSSKSVIFNIGQPLSKEENIQDSILFILDGTARLIGQDGNENYTIGKLGAGAFVGLASLLRVEGCEEVSAITKVIALSIPDQIIISLYEEEPDFREWCKSKLFPAEIHSLVRNLANENALQENNFMSFFKDSLAQVNLHTLQNNEYLKEDKNRIFFTASSNIENHNLHQIIDHKTKLIARPPLETRIISIPIDFYRSISKQKEDISQNETEINNNLIETDSKNLAPILPSRSSIDLGKNTNKKFKNRAIIRAKGRAEEALACLQMLSIQMDLPFRKDAVQKILRDNLSDGRAPTMELLGGICAMLGLHAGSARISAESGTRLQTPSLIPWKGSFVLVQESNSKGLVIASPSEGELIINSEELEDIFPDGIEVLFVDRTNSSPQIKFGANWFWPSLKKYKTVLSQVFLASFIVQLFGLANPLLIQVIIDKVINQRSLDTLQILGIALIFVTILGGIMGGLRTFMFTETTNRIDTRLGSEVIDHLLRLPLNYFDKRPVGELGSRIAELEKIRNFLTGQALTTVLDAAFSVIYILVMVIYSWLLTFIALAVVPLQVGLTLIGTPLIRKQIREVAIENANTQSHLVEVLTGIQTVKAQNVETVSRWKWQNLYNKYISRTFERTITGTALNETSQVLQQLSQLLVLWVGASLVLSGKLTLGQLIAFRIISGYVTQPLLRLSTIWQNLQELRVSFERLADIIDTPEESSESDKTNIPLPSIKGKVEFKNVSFAFDNSEINVLNNINLDIDQGTFTGIVGQSGSGKSTLMKLLPRLYSPNSGTIKIDNYDINKVELYSLRRQVGIVPQDPLLFAGTVSENIALTDPEASSDKIVQAARIAGAHEFIMELPNGYSSNVGERGAGLSGGQRQRIAIARTIISKPKLLIMDEATSALDYNTERQVCDNLKEFCKNTTVFFITHRLSTIKNADLVVMLHQGSLCEIGTHEELMNKLGRYYALYRQQEAS
ncbi:ABC transporter transmembrane domain-containing protein [Prochlorococcus sp. MIT 0801]|uniref:ABC transporter transmembrane domain-containing protein n=1 Tax=Prochlorococcus sp. MIT 0801 TaxID=1501269 RepID=UPI0004F865E5|nr:peptidase domain-containing ABC transporter [Prochlorococcus sp. MIT 0801]AIQ98262.1 Toxin secretion ABC transporter ATP-binding protein [Prochlorococcus sp. MIT 0801]